MPVSFCHHPLPFCHSPLSATQVMPTSTPKNYANDLARDVSAKIHARLSGLLDASFRPRAGGRVPSHIY